MGAYEFGFGDTNLSGKVDLFDMATMQRCSNGNEGQRDGTCPNLDLDLDGDIDLADMAAFVEILARG